MYLEDQQLINERAHVLNITQRIRRIVNERATRDRKRVKTRAKRTSALFSQDAKERSPRANESPLPFPEVTESPLPSPEATESPSPARFSLDLAETSDDGNLSEGLQGFHTQGLKFPAQTKV